MTAFLHPTPELCDDFPIENVRFPTRIRNALQIAGINTVGKIREASDAELLALQDLGKGSVTHLRETLGLSSKAPTTKCNSDEQLFRSKPWRKIKTNPTPEKSGTQSRRTLRGGFGPPYNVSPNKAHKI
jgi:hypothetical protein